jgi:hypothetical protein
MSPGCIWRDVVLAVLNVRRWVSRASWPCGHVQKWSVVCWRRYARSMAEESCVGRVDMIMGMRGRFVLLVPKRLAEGRYGVLGGRFLAGVVDPPPCCGTRGDGGGGHLSKRMPVPPLLS